MRFRNTEDSHIPSIDLIPMLTVMMGVLAFFVVIAVSLSSEQLIQVDLPPEQSQDTPVTPNPPEDPFIVEIDETGQELLNGSPIATEQLTAEIRGYLDRNPDKTVYLVPSRDLSYEQVVQFLGEMRQVGGDRVSLALEESEDPANAEQPTADN